MTRSPDRRDTVLTLAAVLASGVVVVTCSAARGPDAVVPVAPPAPAASPVASASASPIPAVSAPVVAAASASAPAPPTAARAHHGPLALPHFYAAADGLRDKTRKTHARITWLGDSHTMADLWTGVVRRGLVAKLGAGGPGFVHLGFDPKKYRHDGVKLDQLGKFNVLPVPYSKMKREDDGVFGLGGLRFSLAEGEAHAIVEVSDGSARGAELTWDLAYRAEPGASLRVTVGGTEATLRGDEEAGLGGIRHHLFRSSGATGKLDVAIAGGHPDLLGVTIEGETPGVVLDTVGLNGARVGTFLAWDRDAWVAELARRSPSLVVLAFGTNESADKDVLSDKYRKAMASLLERVRAGAPDADCLVITPIDRPGPDYATRLAEITRGYEDAAKAAGCATWSALGAMGGHGSMEAWSHESPPRSGADGIHLTSKGYEFLGQRLAKDLLEGLGG